MGDIADDLIDSGQDAYWAHLQGDCDTLEECQYCRDEERKRMKLDELPEELNE